MTDRQQHNVLLFNDEHTPMEFVVFVLQNFFGMDYDVACQLMLRIHHTGSATCATYSSQEVAEKKVADVLSFAGKHGHPLKCAAQEAH